MSLEDTQIKKEEALMNSNAEPVEIKPLEEMSVKELQTHLNGLGFVGSEILTTRNQLITVINSWNAKKLVSEVDDIAPKKAVRDNEVNEKKSYESKAARYKKWAWSHPIVSFYIPLDPGEKKGAFLPWQRNGYRLNIMKGVSVKIPEPIAKDLEEVFDMTARAGEEFLMDRDERVVKALTGGGDPEQAGEAGNVPNQKTVIEG